MTFIIIYILSLAIGILLFILAIRASHDDSDYMFLIVAVIPILNSFFIIFFFILTLYWEYKARKEEKIRQNKIYKILHTRK